MARFVKVSHPFVRRNKVRVDSKPAGRNRPMTSLPEEDWLRCARCNFVMNRTRHPKGRGDGIQETEVFLGEYDGVETHHNYDSFIAWTANSPKHKTTLASGDGEWPDESYDGRSIKDPVVVGGCPFCGSYMYDEQDPERFRARRG